MKLKKIDKKRLFMLFSLVTGIIALIVALKNTHMGDVLSSFENTTFTLIVAYIFVQVILMLLLTWRWKIVLDSQDVKINFFKLNSFRLVGQAISFLTPTGKVGGEPVRAHLLSMSANTSFRKALSSVVIDKTVDFTTSGLFFLVGASLVLMSLTATTWVTLGFVLIVLLFSYIMFLFNYRVIKGKPFFSKILKFLSNKKLRKIKFLEGIQDKIEDFESYILKFYNKDKMHFFYAIIVSLLSWVVMFVEYKIAGLMLGVNLNVTQIFLIVSFVGLAYMIPVPMALGALEASQISAFILMGLRSSIGIGLSFIVRVKDMIFSFIGLLYLGYSGLKIKKTFEEVQYLDEELEYLKKTEKLENFKKYY